MSPERRNIASVWLARHWNLPFSLCMEWKAHSRGVGDVVSRLETRSFLEGMSVRSKDFAIFAALSVVPAGVALAQPATQAPKPVAAQPGVVAQPRATQPQAASPAVAQPAPAETQPAPVAPPPPPLWTAADANQLLLTILTSAKEGLDPKDYDAAGLIAAMRTNDPVAISAAANERFNKLSSDYALGHVRGADR